MNTRKKDEEEVPSFNVWWKHRRRMAYLSVAWMIFQTIMFCGLELVAPGTVTNLGPIIGWSYGAPSTIILGYFVNTTVEDFAVNKGPKVVNVKEKENV